MSGAAATHPSTPLAGTLSRLRAASWTTIAWRLSVWTVIVLATALATHPLWREITAGALLAVSAVALQFVGESFGDAVRMTAITISTAFGLAAVVAAPSGLAEIPAYIAASRLPYSLDTLRGRVPMVIGTLAVGGTVGLVSHSLVGLLAGFGIPLLAQRSDERRALIAERDRAQALLVEVQAGREAEADAAALQERSRIARDLHDTLAHSLAGLSVQLQGIRAVAVRAQVGAEVLDPLERAGELAREGLVEARAAVGALRNPVGLGMAELPALVARHPGPPMLSSTGTAREVTPEIGHALYRVVQESLTNSARYSPGSTVTVLVDWQPDAVTVRVTDTGGRAAVPDRGTGLGLAGMAERMVAAGGTLTAGPVPGGGWSVEARVPA